MGEGVVFMIVNGEGGGFVVRGVIVGRISVVVLCFRLFFRYVFGIRDIKL